MNSRIQGILAALASAFFLGMAPVFGKMAITMGMPPLAVVAVRTLLAAFLLLFIIVIFRRQYLYIYPAGLLGCLLAGWIRALCESEVRATRSRGLISCRFRQLSLRYLQVEAGGWGEGDGCVFFNQAAPAFRQE